MALPRLIRKSVLKGYIESTYGIPPSDWSTDTNVFYIPAEDISITFPKKTQTRNLAKPTFGADAEYISGFHVQLTFTVELRGDGVDNDTPPNVVEPVVGKLLTACCYNKTEVENDPDSTPGSGDEYISEIYYTPYSVVPTSGHSLSFKLWYAAGEGNNAEAFELVGCVGTYTIRAGGVGERVLVEFTFTGKVNGDPTSESLPTIESVTQKPLFLQGINLTIGSSSVYCLGEIEINGGNEVRIRECASEADGIAGSIITRREATGNILLEGYLPDASNDPEGLFSKFKNGDQFSITIELDSGDDGNHVIIEMPHVQITDLTGEERDDILYRRHAIRLIDTGNDDDIKIRFLRD